MKFPVFLFFILLLTSCSKISSKIDDNSSISASQHSNDILAGDEPLIGFATESGGTTGGAGGSTVTATTYAQLKTALESNDSAKIVLVSGTITGNIQIWVRANKTIQGTTGATLDGVGLRLVGASVHNIIIRNLTIKNVVQSYGGYNDQDAITIKDSAHHVWVDHCDLSTPVDFAPGGNEEYYDGLIDITRASDYVTISWTKFSNSWKACLISGGSNETENAGKLHVTMHHNYFYNCLERGPLAGFGTVHVFNNYYRHDYVTGHLGYSVCAYDNAVIRVENNYWDNTVPGGGTNTSTPIATRTPDPGVITGVSTNTFVNTQANVISTSPGSYTPGYSYTSYLTAVGNVPSVVLGGVGTYSTTTAPSITTQPQSITVTAGQTASLSVVAYGSPTLTYQWKKGGTNVSGATSSVYSGTVSTSDAGNYTVVVTNANGSVTSNTAVVTVNPAGFPTIATQPINKTASVGSTVTLSVVATGNATLTYQWKKNGANISGATSSSLTGTNVQVSDSGNYTVTVTNSLGSVTSSVAVVTIS